VFDVGPDALVVENDGTFTDCGQEAERECPWFAERRTRCDLHSFRTVMGRSKVGREDATGAFGIGFTTVYQVTDEPQLFTGHRHWTMRWLDDPAHRIAQQHLDEAEKGTRFVLPWAREATEFRRRFGVEPVPTSIEKDVLDGLAEACGPALLFLKRVKHIEVRKSGSVVALFERLDRDGATVLRSNGEEARFILLTGDVEGADPEFETYLRETHPRRRTVRVGIPIGGASGPGRLYATLPTSESIPLQLHVDADFFPQTDRKHVLFERDKKSEWNRLALRSAARLVASSVCELGPSLGAERLWTLLTSAAETAQLAASGQLDDAFGSFWSESLPVVRTSNVVLTTRGLWVRPDEARMPAQEVEYESDKLLDALGLAIADREVRRQVFILRRLGSVDRDVGLRELDIPDLLDALERADIVATRSDEAIAPVLRSPSSRRHLWSLFSLMLERQRSDRSEVEASISASPTAPRLGGGISVWRETYIAGGERVVGLFRSIASFLDDDALDPASPLHRLGRSFDVAASAKLLSDAGEKTLEGLDRLGILRWLTTNLDGVRSASTEVRRTLADLPLYPSSDGFSPLTDLVLPGGFDDPLGITQLVHRDGSVPGLDQLLLELGASQLTFDEYVTEHVPRRIAEGTLEDEQVDQLCRLLGEQIHEVDANVEIRATLASLPLVRCTDGSFRSASVVYFDEPDVREAFGDQASYAAPSSPLIHAVHEWLGVRAVPRPEDVVARVASLSGNAPNKESIDAVSAIVAVLGRMFADPVEREARAVLSERFEHDYAELKARRWLPAREDHNAWHRPDELFRRSRDYLFASQARFLGIDRAVENRTTYLLGQLLHVPEEPDVSQVVDHLVSCSRDQSAVNEQVYVFLNQQVVSGDAEAVVEVRRLRGEPVLQIDEGQYVGPDRVFFGDHGLSPFRLRLAEDPFSRWHALLRELGVKDEPDHDDAVQLLVEVSSQAEVVLDQGSDELAAVQTAWHLLELALAEDGIDEDWIRTRLEAHPVVPNNDGELLRPSEIFVEDLVGVRDAFSDELERHCIPRPRSSWRALRAAGVRGLRSAARAEVSSDAPISPDDLVGGILVERQEELARILEASLEGQERDDAFAWLDAVSFERTNELEVKWTLRLGERVLESKTMRMEALYRPSETSVLMVRRGNEVSSWAAVARELAFVICITSDPSHVVAQLKGVLAAATQPDAARELDDLGIPRLQREETRRTGSRLAYFGGEAAAEGAGVDVAALTETAEPETAEPETAEPETAEPETAEPETAEPETAEPETAEPVRGRGTVTNGAQGGSTQRSRAGGRRATGRGRAGGAGESPERKRERAWMIQVSGGPSEETDGDSGDPAAAARNRAVDRAGVDRVLDYERSAGREPREMPHHNPGYDIESFDQGGQKVARYIEVKATSTDWTVARPIGISDTQFEAAQRLGERYWLYVVERAEADDAEVYRICDPAEKATEFRFDPGWKKAAETDGPEAASPLPDLPDVSGALIGAEMRDEGDVPFLEWTELDKVGRADLEDEARQWFTSPATTEAGDFALQQRDGAMGSTLPFGAIAVFRPADGAVENGSVVLADVANENADPRLAIRRARFVRAEDGELEALELVSDVLGSNEDFAFDDSYATGRIRAVLVAYQEL
jgi:hypothetical protein